VGVGGEVTVSLNSCCHSRLILIAARGTTLKAGKLAESAHSVRVAIIQRRDRISVVA
jgi:hypothetical protein